MTERPTPLLRDDFAHFCPISTRWMDNDAYLHVNNVAYYSFFDTAVNEYLIRGGVLDIRRSTVTGLVAQSECTYFSPIAFPEAIEVGCASRDWGAAASPMSWRCFAPGQIRPPRRGASSMSMWTARPAAPLPCPNRCAPCWRRLP